MIIRMPTAPRPQQRYDHRLRDFVQRTGDPTIGTKLGVPRSTAREWLGAAPRVVVSLEVADLMEPELRQEILRLRRRVEKLAAPIRVLRDMPVSQRGRMTPGWRPPWRTRTRAPRRNRREHPTAASSEERAQDRLPIRSPFVYQSSLAELNWRELARRSPECP
jgi:hypothetical protein